MAKFDQLRDAWTGRWNEALNLWSNYVKLSTPRFCTNEAEEKREGLTGSFAMIRLTDHAVVISLAQVAHYELEDYPLEILGHEIGHHVYCPGDLLDHGRMIARMRRGLPEREHLAGFIANLYADLFINDRLRRLHNLRMDDVYKNIAKQQKQDSVDPLWNFYMRIYEILWGLPLKTLVSKSFEMTPELEGDAQLGNRVIRNYAGDWPGGAGRFAALCYPYIVQDNGAAAQSMLRPLMDSQQPGDGDTVPAGLTEIDPEELSGAIHPALDPEFDRAGDGEEDGVGGDSEGPGGKLDPNAQGGGPGQHREPFEYGQILRSLGMDLSDVQVAVRYYRERAAPHLVSFPVREVATAADPLPEGLDVWDPGSPLERIDWIETAVRSPIIIPGFTTYERVYGITEGGEPEVEPVDLDLYVDCSGSMPNPARAVSYPALAGAIIALSALRVGSRVQATLWSGAKQFQITDGFVSDEEAILSILCGYLGGGTAFPIHVLRDTYASRRASDRKVHILIISDDGVTTMFNNDEQQNSGWDIAARALAEADGGGTMVLQLYHDVDRNPQLVKAGKMGWDIHRIAGWDDLTAFARAFSRKHYAADTAAVRSGR